MKKFDRSHEAKCRNDHWFTNTAPVGLYMLNIRSFVQHDDYVETTHERKKHYSPTCENRQPKQKATVLVSATHQWNTVYTQPSNERTNNNNNTTAVWRNERLQSLLPYLSSIAFTLTYEHWIIRMAKKELPMRKSGNTLTKLWLIFVHYITYYMGFYKQGHNSLFENKYRYFLYLFWYFSTYLQRKFRIKNKKLIDFLA